MQFQADTVLGYPSVSHFNGDDALILVKSTDTLDVIGVPGVDPGSSWTVGTVLLRTTPWCVKQPLPVVRQIGLQELVSGMYMPKTLTLTSGHTHRTVQQSDVTFQVDMNNVSASYTNVYVSGTLNSSRAVTQTK